MSEQDNPGKCEECGKESAFRFKRTGEDKSLCPDCFFHIPEDEAWKEN